MGELGLEPRAVAAAPSPTRPGQQAAREDAARCRPLPTAVVAANDLDRGRRDGRLRVATACGCPTTSAWSATTTRRSPGSTWSSSPASASVSTCFGSAAVELLVNRIDDPHHGPAHGPAVSRTTPVGSGSTACPAEPQPSVNGGRGTATGGRPAAAIHSVSWPAPHADRGSPTSRPSPGSAAPPWTASCTAATGVRPETVAQVERAVAELERQRTQVSAVRTDAAARPRHAGSGAVLDRLAPGPGGRARLTAARGAAQPGPAQRAERPGGRRGQSSTGSPSAAPTASSSRRPTTPLVAAAVARLAERGIPVVTFVTDLPGSRAGGVRRRRQPRGRRDRGLPRHELGAAATGRCW